MDEKTYNALKNIGRTIPKDLLRKAIRKEQPLRDGVAEYLKYQKTTTRFLNKDSQKKVDEIKKFYDKGAFDHVSTNIDPVAEKKIEQHIEGKLNYLIKTKQIKPPKLDSWAMRIMEKAGFKKI